MSKIWLFIYLHRYNIWNKFLSLMFFFVQKFLVHFLIANVLLYLIFRLCVVELLLVLFHINFPFFSYAVMVLVNRSSQDLSSLFLFKEKKDKTTFFWLFNFWGQKSTQIHNGILLPRISLQKCTVGCNTTETEARISEKPNHYLLYSYYFQCVLILYRIHHVKSSLLTLSFFF